MLNGAGLNETALNGGSSDDCQSSGALNGSALNDSSLNGNGTCATVSGSSGSTPSYATGTAVLGLTSRTFNAGLASLGLTSLTYATGSTTLGLTSAVVAATGAASLGLTGRTYVRGQAILGLTSIAGTTIGRGSASLGLTGRTYRTGSASLDLLSRVIEPIDWSDVTLTRIFASQVLINGVQILTTGQIKVTKEEGSAAVANFSVIGAPTLSIDDLVEINLIVGSHIEPMFTGRITEPSYDPAERVSSYQATDQFQRRIDALTRDQIDGLVPDATTTSGNDDNGWNYLQHRLDSWCGSVDLDRFGQIHVTRWDQAIDLGTSIDAAWNGTEQLSLVRANTLSNQIDLDLTLSWVRLAKREVAGEWRSPWTICQFLGYDMNFVPSLPTQSTIENAIDGLGWTVENLTTQTMGNSADVVYCAGHNVATTGLDIAIKSASWTISKRYSRSMQANVKFVLSAASSISAYGLRRSTESDTYRDESTDSDWLSTDVGSGDSSGIGGGSTDGTLVPGGSTATAPAEVTLTPDPAGDGIHDQLDGTAAAAAALDSLNRAIRKIISSHRATTVSASMPMRPDIERHHRATLNLPSITAAGKVSVVEHVLDTDGGTADTTLTIRLLQGGDGQPIGASNVQLPDLRLDQITTRVVDESTDAPTFALNSVDTHVGALPNSPAEDDTWQGWVFNVDPIQSEPVYQNTGFILESPDITLPDQTDADVTRDVEVAVHWPNDELTYH